MTKNLTDIRQQDRSGKRYAGLTWLASELKSVFYLNGPSLSVFLDRNKIVLNTLWARLKILNWTRKLFSPSLRRIYFYFLSFLQFYCFFMLSVGPVSLSAAANRCNKWNQRKKSISAARNVNILHFTVHQNLLSIKKSRLFPGLMYFTVKRIWLPLFTNL